MPKNDKAKIIDYIKKAKPRSTKHQILSQDEFLNGLIAKVEFEDSSNQVEQYVILTRKHSGYADNESQLIQQMEAAAKNHKTKVDIINQIFNAGGLIAILLALTACYIVIFKEGNEIPEFLKTSLLTIIGFYFGGYVHQQKKQKNEEG